jgi:hypothetical protein
MNVCQQLLRTGNLSRQATPVKTDTDIGQTAERHDLGRVRLENSQASVRRREECVLSLQCAKYCN